jgi:hypothetical protein
MTFPAGRVTGSPGKTIGTSGKLAGASGKLTGNEGKTVEIPGKLTPQYGMSSSSSPKWCPSSWTTVSRISRMTSRRLSQLRRMGPR